MKKMNPVVHFEMPAGKQMDIPGIGNFVMFKDTEGNRVGMMQPVKM